MLATRERGADTAEVLKYMNSGDVTGIRTPGQYYGGVSSGGHRRIEVTPSVFPCGVSTNMMARAPSSFLTSLGTHFRPGGETDQGKRGTTTSLSLKRVRASGDMTASPNPGMLHWRSPGVWRRRFTQRRVRCE